MNTWFECSAKYAKMDENGHEKKVTETYLLDAVSFSEAESRIYKELQTMVSGEFIVTKIVKTKISEIIPSEDGDRWYKAKVAFITVDEESGKEKRISQLVLVYSTSIKEAYDQIVEAMQGMMADFESISISESNILDVFPYSEAEKDIPANLKLISEFANAPHPFEDYKQTNEMIPVEIGHSEHPKTEDSDLLSATVRATGQEIDVELMGDGISWLCISDNTGNTYKEEELDFGRQYSDEDGGM